MPVINRYYSSSAVRTTITAAITATDTSVAVAAVTGFPASTPFTIVLDEGQVSEEIVTVTAVSALTLTVTRGVDGTTAVAHALGAKAVHALTARDLREPQEHIAAEADVHGLVGNLGTTIRALAGLRNRVMNGSFRVNQRAYVSGAALAVSAYGFDRWKATVAATTLTFTALPNGQTVTINDTGAIAQVIERADMPAGTVLMSWAGTATGRLYASGSTAPAYAASPVVVTQDGLADIVIEFTATGGAKTLGTIQVEAGTTTSVVSPFEVRPLGMELALCRRYFWRQVHAVTGRSLGVGQAYAADNSTVHLQTLVPMRVAPTVTPSAVGHFSVQKADGTATVVTAMGLTSTHPEGLLGGVTCAAVLTAGHATLLLATTAGAFLDWSAEL